MRLLIVGGTGGTTIGSSFRRAAEKDGLDVSYLDTALAYEANALARRAWWHLLGRRPYRLREFSALVVRTALERRVDMVLATGLAPVDAAALEKLGAERIARINFLTDDPWNPAHSARWFSRCLPSYDFVFTPRRANIRDLENEGCRQVRYLPFGYDEDICFPEKDAATAGESADVYFAGGADADRVRYIEALASAGMRVQLHGSYWERFAGTRALTLGQADPETMRRGLSSAKVGLCLVRQANRDGNSMRTFEVPAIGACLLAEDTPEHREIFGTEGDAAAYFSSVPEMVDKARHLVADDAYRKRLASAGHALITQGHHTYRDRLNTIREIAGAR